MGKVGKDRSHYIQGLYSVLCCIVHQEWGGSNVEDKSNNIRVETMSLKNIGRIEYGKSGS